MKYGVRRRCGAQRTAVMLALALVWLASCMNLPGQGDECVVDVDCPESGDVCVDGFCVALDDLEFEGTPGFEPGIDPPDVTDPDATDPGACLEASPRRVDFGTIDVNEVVSVDLDLTNCGTAILRDVRLDLDNEQFGVRLGPVRPPLAPGGTMTVTVNFRGITPGTFQGTLTAAGEPGGAMVEVPLQVRVRDDAPQTCLEVEPELLDFGIVPVDETSSRPFALRNCGNVPVRDIVWTFEGDDFLPSVRPNISADRGFSLQPGEARSLRLEVSPFEEAAFEGDVIFSSARQDDAAATLEFRGSASAVPLSGCVRVEPDSLEFGPIPAGTVESRTAMFENCGELGLNVAGLEFQGSGRGAFRVLGQLVDRLEPGERVEVEFTYVATAPGNEDVASFMVAYALDDESFGEVSVLLVGRTEADQNPGLCVEYDPAELDFGTVAAGSPPVTRNVQVRNCGRAPIRVNPETASGEGVFRPLVNAASLPAGGSVQLQVTFETGQAQPGLNDDEILLNPDQPLRRLPVRAILSEPVPPARCLSVNPAALDAGEVEVGSSRVLETELRNCGESRLDIEATLQPTAAPWLIDGPVSLAPGDTMPWQVEFVPTGAGQSQAQVRFAVEGEQVGQLELRGRGVVAPGEPCLLLELEQDRVTFGQAAEIEGRLSNCGEVPLFVLLDRFEPTGSTFQSQLQLPVQLGPGQSVDGVLLRYGGGGQPGSLVAWEIETAEGQRTSAGVFIDSAEPCFEVTPESLSLPPVRPGETATGVLRVRNCSAQGQEARLDFVPSATPIGDFRLDQPILPPLFFQPFESRDFAIAFDAADLAGSTQAAGVDFTVTDAGGEVRATANVRAIVEPDEPPPPVICLDSPDAAGVDFGFIEAGTTSRRTVTIVNCGDETVTVGYSAQSPQPGIARFQVLGPSQRTLPPGGGAAIPVDAITGNPGSTTGQFVVFIPGENQPRLNVDLRATVELAPPPPIECLDMPERTGQITTTVGSHTDFVLTVTNCGEASLQGLRMEIEAFPEGILSSRSSTDTSGFNLAPGQSRNLQLRLNGLIPIDSTGVVRVSGTNSAAEAFTIVLFRVEDDAPPPTPCVSVEPEGTLAFGTVNVGSNRNRPVRLTNCGDLPLRYRAPDISPPNTPFRTNAPPLVIPPGETATVQITFSPVSGGVANARLNISPAANALPGTPSVDVLLTGTGRDATPLELCLAFDPEVLNFGVVTDGSPRELPISLSNCGDTPLLLSEPLIVPEGGGFRIAQEFGPPMPGPLLPGGRLDGIIRFEASASGTYTARIQATGVSEGGAQFTASAVLNGTIEDDATPICREPRPRATRTLNGPQGPWGAPIFVRIGQEILLEPNFDSPLGPGETVTWSLTRAPAGAPTLFRPENDRGRVSYTPEVAGEYRFRVRYRSDDCIVDRIVDSIVTDRPNVGQGLRVVITWRTPGDPNENSPPGSDVDLHFLRVSDGQAFWNRSGHDVYYASRTADWGAPGPPNDPELLRDETQGLGPEIIVLPDPFRSERFLVGIYYWSDRGFGHSDVTLRIFRDNVQLTSTTRRLDRTRDFWLGADLILEGEFITFPDLPIYDGFPAPSVVP